MIDWDKFASRVPAGAMIKFTTLWLQGNYVDGILIENKPYWGWDHGKGNNEDNPDEPVRLLVQATGQSSAYWDEPKRVEVGKMQFLIGDAWYTFDEIMALSDEHWQR